MSRPENRIQIPWIKIVKVDKMFGMKRRLYANAGYIPSSKAPIGIAPNLALN
jgi:hypothetical protein